MPVITDFDKQPEDKDCKLWRYMDFSKFMSLITTSQLYFSRSDKFPDIYEGHLSSKLLLEMFTINNEKNTKNIIKNEGIEATRYFCNHIKEFTFINCWHKNEYESDAMWKLYSKVPEAIAIETTYTKLINSILVNPSTNIFISEVSYLDYNTEKNSFSSVMSPFTSKGMSYKHEEEVRLVLQTMYMKKKGETILESHGTLGKYINVDLNSLIEKYIFLHLLHFGLKTYK